jgi:hypothetical protein
MASIVGLNVSMTETLEGENFIEIDDSLGRIKAYIVDREDSLNLPESWDKTTGIYVLLSPVDATGKFTAYVGLTDYSFQRRMKDHNKNKDFWQTVILFKSLLTTELDSMQTRYLEGALVDTLESFGSVKLVNIKPTGQPRLSEVHFALMNSMVDAIVRVLRLRGYKQPLKKKVVILDEEPPKKENGEITKEKSKGMFSKLFKPEPLAPPLLVAKEPKRSAGENFELLKKWRYYKSKKEDRPAFRIFTNEELVNIIDANPKTIKDIEIAAPKKKKEANIYGEEVLAILNT